MMLVGRLCFAQLPTPTEVALKQINRSAYDVLRDGKGAMRINPLPFTKVLPPGTLNFEVWPAFGYEDDVSLIPRDDAAGNTAAGICTAGAPCSFSFVYTCSVEKNYTGKLDLVGIRYVLSRASTRLAEGLIWGTDEKADYYLREGSSWRLVPLGEERERMKRAVQAFVEHHKIQVAAVNGQLAQDK
jgi:hypothetical protein